MLAMEYFLYEESFKKYLMNEYRKVYETIDSTEVDTETLENNKNLAMDEIDLIINNYLNRITDLVRTRIVNDADIVSKFSERGSDERKLKTLNAKIEEYNEAQKTYEDLCEQLKKFYLLKNYMKTQGKK